MNPDIVGYIGTCILGVTLMPQVYHTYKTKRVEHMSLTYILLQMAANAIYIYYGYLIKAVPIIACNVWVGGLSSCLLLAKWKFQEPEEYITLHQNPQLAYP